MRSLVVAVSVFAVALCSPATAGATSTCAALGGTVGPTDYCGVSVKKPSYTMDLTFPVDFPDQAAVDGYVKKTRDEFLAAAEDPNAWNGPYELNLTSGRYSTKSTRSVVSTVEQYTGGAHPSTWYKAFNYDVAAGRAVTFGTLFAPGADAMAALAPAVTRDFTEQTGDATALNPGAAGDPSNYQNFAINDDYVIFYFDQGAVAAGAVGAREVWVRRSVLPPLAI
jgi:uncharacterized protein DUF3298